LYLRNYLIAASFKMIRFELNIVFLPGWRGRPLNLIKHKDELLLQVLYFALLMNKSRPAP